jgi:hypothetical protein
MGVIIYLVYDTFLLKGFEGAVQSSPVRFRENVLDIRERNRNFFFGHIPINQYAHCRGANPIVIQSFFYFFHFLSMLFLIFCALENAFKPSFAAYGTINNAATGSAHHQPSHFTSNRPISTTTV